MEQQIRFCTTSDGVSIAYATVGEGPPLVVVPGWVSHLEVLWEWPDRRRFLEALAEHFLVVSYDKRGTGLSDRAVGDYSTEARVRDLEAVVDSMKLDRTALYGLSEGGTVAIAYAARHPRVVSRMVLYGTQARMMPTPAQRETIDALEALVRAEWGLGSRTLTNLFMPGATAEDVSWFVKLQEKGATSKDAADMLRANVEADVFDLLSQVRAPTLVIHVTGDRVIPFERGREIAGHVPNARLVAIEGDRHAVDAGGIAQINEASLNFLLEDYQGTEKTVAAPPGLATILFTDMESSTALRRRLGDAQVQELVRTHNEIVRTALREHAGQEIKHTGDGIMASFSTATAALQCSIAIQQGVAIHVELHPETPLRVYIGLNAGEPIAEEQDLFGTSVDLARRICDHAEPGQILASNVVRELAEGKGFLFGDIGDVVPKGFEEPVRLYEVRGPERQP